MSVGDVNSQERGSGARYNEGKTPYELLFLPPLVRTFNLSSKYYQVLWSLAHFQTEHNRANIVSAIQATVDPARYCSLSDFKPAAEVFEYGKRKYAEWNWLKGMRWSIPFGCALRHLDALMMGEETDPESGLPHLGHLQCNLLMLLTFIDTFPEGNDLPKIPGPSNVTPSSQC